MRYAKSSAAVPALRFKGFEGEWSALRAKDLFVEVTDKNHSDLPVLSAHQQRGMIRRDDGGSQIQFDRNSLSTYKRVTPGQFVLHLRSFQGGFAHSAIEGIASPAYTVFQFRDRDVHNDLFWKYYFNSQKFIESLKVITYGIRDGRSIAFEDYCGLSQMFPSIVAEQRSIGSCFRSLDALISSRTAGVKKLEELKKSMLVKMFPQGDSLVPEIRFKEFKGKWEQVTLSSIAERVLEKNFGGQYKETFTNSAELGVISQRNYFDFDVAKNTAGYYVVRDNDFVYNPRISTSAPVGPINRNSLGRVGVMSPLYFVFRTHDITPEFLEVLFKTSVWHPYMKYNGDSGARSDRFSIKNELFMAMPILRPTLPEQRKIAAYFRALDDLLAARKAELKKLREMKSALLERMFV